VKCCEPPHGEYLGREIEVPVLYVATGIAGLDNSYCAMSLGSVRVLNPERWTEVQLRQVSAGATVVGYPYKQA